MMAITPIRVNLLSRTGMKSIGEALGQEVIEPFFFCPLEGLSEAVSISTAQLTDLTESYNHSVLRQGIPSARAVRNLGF